MRERLIYWLERLAESDRQAGGRGTINSDEQFDQILDFFDDTGVLDDPARALGYVLRSEGEVEAMRSLSVACNAVLDLPESSLMSITATGEWREFVRESRRALNALDEDSSSRG
ncbi:hypothetical protein [Streptomyces sp. NPDC007206]|uniref:SCO4402 family protein n=1 Tax=Streptomyces sp. NPDC007206 TaxID=3154317 RepID=UPI0033E1C815